MLKVGITGSIGSGKSTVCRAFEAQGVPVYYADDRAKWLMQNDQTLKTELIKHFGADTFDQKGTLNRAYLAQRVFQDTEALQMLNSLVHPAVFEDGIRWMAEQEAQGATYALKEAALLFESGSHKTLDKVIVVTAPLDARIQRVKARDNVTEAQVRARMDKQWTQAQKVAAADFEIENNRLEDLPQKIEAARKQLLAWANEKQTNSPTD